MFFPVTFFIAFVLSVNCRKNYHKYINVSCTVVVGCCVAVLSVEGVKQEKERQGEGPVARKRKVLFTIKSHW